MGRVGGADGAVPLERYGVPKSSRALSLPWETTQQIERGRASEKMLIARLTFPK
jgi:hypothetical protein